MWSLAATVVFNCPHSRGSVWQVFCPRSRPCGAFSLWLQGAGLLQAGVSCGGCPSLVSAQQGSQRSLGSPGPSILQRPAAWGPCNPHTLRFWGFPPHRYCLEGPGSEPGLGRLTGVPHCHHPVCEGGGCPRSKDQSVRLVPRGLWTLGWVWGLFPHWGLTLFALAA